MKRGEIWLAQVGRKRRPVLVLTRTEVIDVRALVTVAEITTRQRGLAAEVSIDPTEAGVDRESAVNCDGIHTVPQTVLTEQIGGVSPATLRRVCRSLAYALGC
ncbi:MAG: type II toxin-antitoxin system PemK/MazF family toxin [Acidimicrobiia bacterium]|nr:type II toxin-antitoxin system PemK/MazF family toxin [Acidimicrobiia bacterium]MDJ0664407.1 type II toxin-antitoxin system PemK/MazF family toxin [Acidimicrobiia bacterium]